MLRATVTGNWDGISPDVSYRIMRTRLAKEFKVLPEVVDEMSFADATDLYAYEQGMNLIQKAVNGT